MTIKGCAAKFKLSVGRIIVRCMFCDCRQIFLSVLISGFAYIPINASAGILDWFFPPETPPKIALAISTTANLAEPLTRDILNKKFVRLLPGSRLLVMDRVDQASGKQLALSVDGVWVYVNSDEITFTDVVADTTNNSRSIIMRSSVAVPLSDGGLEVVMKKGTVLPLHENNASSGPFLTKINSSVFKELRSDKTYQVPIERDMAAMIDKSVKDASAVDFFTRGFAGKSFGQFKGCNESVLQESEYKAAVSAKLSAKAVYGELTVSADIGQRLIQTTTMNADEIVTVRYYRRSNSGGEYIWKEIESCTTGEVKYLIRVPGPSEVIINAQIMHARGIKLDPFIKKPYISCDEDYDKLASFLEEKMEIADTRFFIALIARWKNHGDMETCTSPG